MPYFDFWIEANCLYVQEVLQPSNHDQKVLVGTPFTQSYLRSFDAVLFFLVKLDPTVEPLKIYMIPLTSLREDKKKKKNTKDLMICRSICIYSNTDLVIYEKASWDYFSFAILGQ